jgi:quercetin dioxygenase-like cupin family protein
MLKGDIAHNRFVSEGGIMQNDLIERGWTDMNAASPASGAVAHLTDPADSLWAGIVELGRSETYTLEPGWRHDLYVLHGSVEVDGQRLHYDDFLVQCGAGVVRAGQNGARLFAYREAAGAHCEPMLSGAASRAWRDGRNPQMRVAPLSNHGHIVSMVAWQPGAHTTDHGHSNGEEIFVLSGELRNAVDRYPAGSWLRLHPGARHEPFAEVPTVILLRNGHLPAASRPRAGDGAAREEGTHEGNEEGKQLDRTPASDLRLRRRGL